MISLTQLINTFIQHGMHGVSMDDYIRGLIDYKASHTTKALPFLLLAPT